MLLWYILELNVEAAALLYATSVILFLLCNFESIQSINSSACRKREYETDLTLTLVMYSIVKCSCVVGQFKVVKSDPLCLIFPENVSGTTSLRMDTVPQLTLH